MSFFSFAGSRKDYLSKRATEMKSNGLDVDLDDALATIDSMVEEIVSKNCTAIDSDIM